GMGDRHFDSTTTQKTTGSDNKYGFGRVKLRLTSDYGQRALSTFSLTSSTAWAPFSSPLPSGTNLVKCVLLQEEDMSSKSTVSNVDLTVKIQTPSAGSCGTTDTTQVATATDSSYDTKSMVAFTSGSTTLSGNCVKVTANPLQIAGSAATVHVLCA